MASYIKRETNESVYKIKTESNDYLVILEGLKNDMNGNKRYKARIINLINPYNAIIYTFAGHYIGEQSEAVFIVAHHEEEIMKKRGGK